MPPDAAAAMALQGLAGNQSVASLLGGGMGPPAAQRAPTAAPAAAPAAPATPAPIAGTPVTAPAGPPGPATNAEEMLFPIWDRRTQGRLMVTAERYEVERAQLGRMLRYLAQEIPADATKVLDDYPFEAVKDMYAERIDDLKTAGRYYARGDLLMAGAWAREARRYVDIEGKAHKILLDEGVFSYTAKRVSFAIIGIFQGAAETLLGLVDQGASLVGYHPGLAEWNTRQYEKIKTGYGSVVGIEHTAIRDDELGRLGGRVATGLALAKLPGGTTATVINTTQAAAGVKDMVVTLHRLKTSGKSWGDIFSDPKTLAQVAGALAGVAGMGSAGLPHLKSFFDQSGLVLTATQMTTLTIAIATFENDKTKSGEENYNERLNLIADLLTTAGSTADARVSAAKAASTAESTAPTTGGEAPGSPTAGGEATTTVPAKAPAEAATTVPAKGPAEAPAPASGTEPAPGTARPDSEPGAAKAGTGKDVGPAPTDVAAAELLVIAVNEAQAAAARREAILHAPVLPHGIGADAVRTLQQVADQFNVVIKARPVNPAAEAAIQRSALPKMELIKTKSINELDLLIGAPQEAVGLVGMFQPHDPPANIDPALRAKALERKAERAKEYAKYEAEYRAYEAEGLVRIEGPLIKVLDPRAAPDTAGSQFKPVAGDIDLFDITHADGTPLSPDQQTLVTNLLRSMGIGVEHGAHEWWKQQSPESFNQGIYDKIRNEHLWQTPLVAFVPGDAAPRNAWADTKVVAPPREEGRTTPIAGAEAAPVQRPVMQGPDPIAAPVIEGVTIDWSTKLAASGYEGSLSGLGAGFGVFEATLPGGEVVAVKVYPGSPAKRAMVGREVEGLQAAQKVGIGPDVHGIVQLDNNRIGIVMEKVPGAMVDHQSLTGMTPEQAARAVAEATAARERVTSLTVGDLDTFRKALLAEGYYYDGEVQGFVTPDGRWRPIDFQSVRRLPPESDPVARKAAIAEHNRNFKEQYRRLRDALEERRRRRP